MIKIIDFQRYHMELALIMFPGENGSHARFIFYSDYDYFVSNTNRRQVYLESVVFRHHTSVLFRKSNKKLVIKRICPENFTRNIYMFMIVELCFLMISFPQYSHCMAFASK